VNILVLVKQVPETDKVKMDPETGTMIRSGQESIINPLDLYAIEKALVLKEEHGAHVRVMSMGPPDSQRALREALSMGCDDATLLTDRAFAGSDTWATSRVLAKAIEEAGKVDLILSGERATDGDTGQVGPAVAAWLGIPAITYASSLEMEEPAENGGSEGLSVIARRFTEEGYQAIRVRLPCLVTVVKEIASPRLPTLRGKKRAKAAEIARRGAADLGFEGGSVGLAGSPTRVVKIFYPKVARNGERILAVDEPGIDAAVARIISLLAEKGGMGAIEPAPAALAGTFRQTQSVVERAEVMEDPAPARSPGKRAPQFWILAERRGGSLDPIAFELLARARPLADARGASLVAVLPTPNFALSDAETLVAYGADHVVALEGAEFSTFVCQPWAETLFRIAREREPEVILAAATSSGRTLMPYLAIKLRTGLTADCTELAIEEKTGLLLQTRPAIGGNIMATIKTSSQLPQMATVRPHSMRPLPFDSMRRGNLTRIASGRDPHQGGIKTAVEFLGLERDSRDFENLEGARTVVSGGRGLKKSDNFKLVRELAEALGAATGASREAVDRGWISYAHQVGLSGKTISPDVYICAGVSGAIQHLAGIRTAKTIISINSDPEAPIHAVADLAVVGDLFEILPRLTKTLKERRHEL